MRKAIRWLGLGLGLLFAVASQALAPALTACFERLDCQFQLWGAGTDEPWVTMLIPRTVWLKLPEADRQWIRDSLRQQVISARREPDNAMIFLNSRIPPTAPFYRQARANVRRTVGYFIFLNTERVPSGAWKLGQEAERTIVPQ